jgi:hypothetical protein
LFFRRKRQRLWLLSRQKNYGSVKQMFDASFHAEKAVARIHFRNRRPHGEKKARAFSLEFNCAATIQCRSLSVPNKHGTSTEQNPDRSRTKPGQKLDRRRAERSRKT